MFGGFEMLLESKGIVNYVSQHEINIPFVEVAQSGADSDQVICSFAHNWHPPTEGRIPKEIMCGNM